MKLTIEQCINVYKTLEQVKNTNNLSFSFAWKVEDILTALKKYVQRGQDEQLKLLNKFGQEDKNKPGVFNVNPDKLKAYKTALKEVFSHDVELDIKPIDYKDFVREKVVIIKEISINALKPIIKN